MARKKKSKMQWYKMDLHLHTPASADWQEPGVRYLDLLRRAEMQGLDIIAITDHNTVAGCAALQAEIEKLSLLEDLGRIQPEERRQLDEYRRIGNKILVLPGFEFTATLGFHVLAIFSPETSLRKLEHLLIELNVSAEKLDLGATEVGATADVLTAYRLIDEAGGLVVAAHANSSHGVALRGLDFGGQTRIAYTQDRHLHALEVTDLEKKGRRTTAWFFGGHKPEYPRRMHCIQGSDAHRLTRDPSDPNRLGWGSRVTEIQLPEPSFEAIKAVFLEDDFSRTRPYRPAQAPFDHVQAAREEGPSIVQSFHESMTSRGGRLNAVLRDVVAMANTNGGTVYIGVRADPKALPVGIEDADEEISRLKAEIQRKVQPPLDVDLNTVETQGRTVIQISVPAGEDAPYALDGTSIYVRQESDTNPAMRDEILALVQRAMGGERPPCDEGAEDAPETQSGAVPAPKTGVQILDTEERKGTMYHTVRDLRNGNVVRNVTRSSARKLWQYAITQHESSPVDKGQVQWVPGNERLGLWKSSRRAGKVRYDLVQRMPDGRLQVYYGVTEDGIDGPWRAFLKD
ncbi:MAG: putative DNA binding domain-containing protein [Anaerolineae bacterium]|nr:putative DNA binding domain-containing protein [Anaerolineae bacterium]MDX9829605.1 putative DNA binding domain-containing protein [Anaerolineae bacterium]